MTDVVISFDTEDFQAAYNELIKQEAAGIAAVKAATGVERLYAANPPGVNESYVALYGYYDLGIPCYSGEMLDSPKTNGSSRRISRPRF